MQHIADITKFESLQALTPSCSMSVFNSGFYPMLADDLWSELHEEYRDIYEYLKYGERGFSDEDEESGAEAIEEVGDNEISQRFHAAKDGTVPVPFITERLYAIAKLTAKIQQFYQLMTPDFNYDYEYFTKHLGPLSAAQQSSQAKGFDDKFSATSTLQCDSYVYNYL